MTSVFPVQSAFSSGEHDPRLKARVDLKAYYSGGERMRNVRTTPQGSVRRRGGTRFITAYNQDGLLIPFQFNTEQTYMMVLLGNTMDVYVNRAGPPVATISGMGYTPTQALSVTFCQSADTLLLFHPDVQPRKVVRGASHSSWTVSTVTFTNIPKFNYTGTPEDVISTTKGWPRCATFHEQRLWLGGLKSRPATLLGSVIADFFNLDTATVTDEKGINITMDTAEINPIRRLASLDQLQVFTSGGTAMVPSSANVPITPKNVSIRAQTGVGASTLPVVSVEGAVMYVNEHGNAVQEHIFTDVEQKFAAQNVSLLAGHLIAKPTDFAHLHGSDNISHSYIFAPNSVALTDGTPAGSMAVLNTLRSQQITGWTCWTTVGEFKRAAVEDDALWFLVRRVVQGTPRFHLEVYDEGRNMDDSVWVHVTVTPISVVTGLGHLEGMTVDVNADGTYAGQFVVTGGQVTLPMAGFDIEVGLPFRIEVKTMPAHFDAQGAPIFGKRKRVRKVLLRLIETQAVSIQGWALPIRQFSDPGSPLDTPIPHFTGDIETITRGWARDGQVVLTQQAPLAFETLGCSYELVF